MILKMKNMNAVIGRCRAKAAKVACSEAALEWYWSVSMWVFVVASVAAAQSFEGFVVWCGAGINLHMATERRKAMELKKEKE